MLTLEAFCQVFQSTRPCGARLRGATLFLSVLQFQSTRPCGARQSLVGCVIKTEYVSIHAPVRGATLSDKLASETAGVSIHAPVRGATYLPMLEACPSMFQSTRPCGARQRKRNQVEQLRNVSIHAPVRGATGGRTQGEE